MQQSMGGLSHVNIRARNVIRVFCRAIRDLPYVKRIYLYGSYAKNTYTTSSDCDIAVFVDDDSPSLKDLHRQIAKSAINGRLDIQPQVFSVSELRDPIGIVEEIVTHGIEL